MANTLTLSSEVVAGGPFEQQGSIDWVQIAKMSVTLPVSILARVTAADVSPLTIVVGQEMSSLFRLSTTGHERLNKALGELKSFSAIGDAIWFGFGIKHIVRVLAETDKGLACLTLCGCLSEIHPPKACAEILIRLASVCDAPDDLRPSSSQWINLIEACSGTLKSTTFACIAEQFMAFHQHSFVEEYTDEAEDVARALLAVARVSSGVLSSVTLAGGRSCGWIAAIGFYFLGLEIEIRNADNASVFKSTTNDDSIRVLVIYGTAQSSNQVQVNRTGYFINSLDNIILSYEQRFDSVMSGTLHWDSCLSTTFGDSFGQLLKAKEDFGQLIGAAALVFQGLTNSATNICKAFSATSVGGICFYFNILRDVSDRPENAMTLHVVPGVIQTNAGRRHSFITDRTGPRPDGLLGYDWQDNFSYQRTAECRIDYQASITESLGGNISIPVLSMDTGSSDLNVKLFVEESAVGLLVDLHFLSSAGNCRVGAYAMLKEIIENSGLVPRGRLCTSEPQAENLPPKARQ
ncbi:hypothetical protein FNAPI_8322 [Fusarium napiforme]|uniref:Uncharacterized protein n=1 Tax=Fusarium napiforme TaxID=42672 RepID=A0A8H5J3J8_9HYPO|nr:hypothetical protein FNAPI_8322 [Fusarium napiforme]